MQEFLNVVHDQITGVLHCFDRLIFRGHLPLTSTSYMSSFLNHHNVLLKDLKSFLPRHAARLKEHAEAFAAKAGRPYRYLNTHQRKNDEARAMVEQDGIEQGLVCVFAAVEPCRSFAMRGGEGRPTLVSAKRKCLFLYYYFMDRDLGLMHVRLQTWFPFEIQVYLNGHDVLARKLDRHGIAYTKVDNAFTWIADPARAQRFADRLVDRNWPRILSAFAQRVNPLLADLLEGMTYYWVTDQSEFATDIMFRSQTSLQAVYPKLLRHATLCFSAEDVLSFLGRKLHPQFAGEVITDCKRRYPGARVKHRMKENWIKMYDKHGCVLRIETVINRPREFKVRRKGIRRGEQVIDWFPMAKGVCNLYRYRQVSLQANRRYLDALAAAAVPSESYPLLHRVCEPARFQGRRVRGLNPLAPADVRLFATVIRGEHSIAGFRSGDVARRGRKPSRDPLVAKRECARTGRQLQKLRAHGLIAKIPRTHRYRVTPHGYKLMVAAVHLYEEGMPQLLQAA